MPRDFVQKYDRNTFASLISRLPDDQRVEWDRLLNALLFKNEMKKYPYSTSTTTPSTDEFPDNDDWGFHVDSVAGKVYVAFNHNGTVKKVELT